MLYSAHGVAPAIRAASAERRLRAIDATCPLVTKVHLEAVRFAREGYTILLIGHEGHDEVLGTMGEAPDDIRLVQDEADVEALDLPAGREGGLPDADDAERGRRRGHHRRPEAALPARSSARRKDDICYATQNRQEAVKDLVPEADVVLVLGSQNSSNSKRLAEIARACGKPAYLIDGVKDLREDWFTRRRDGAGHGRRQRPGGRGRGVHRLLAAPLRRDGREPHGARGARQLPAAARAAGDRRLRQPRAAQRGNDDGHRHSKIGPLDHGRPMTLESS